MYVSDDQRDQERKMDNSFNIHSFTKAPISSHSKTGSVPSPGFKWSSGRGRAEAGPHRGKCKQRAIKMQWEWD